MNHIKFILLLYAIIAAALPGCEKDSVAPLDPAKAILGKWEIIEKGNWPDLEPYPARGYTEYLPDSMVRFFEYDKNQYTDQRKYWIDDSLLYNVITRPDGVKLVTPRYYYQFSDNNNKLRLDVDGYAIFNTSVYKRIK